MSKLARLKDHILTLDDIRHIMKALKNHAMLEINKMTKFIATQEKSVKTINEVGTDFFSFYPSLFTMPQEDNVIICILIGSERGFCGNFNEAIVQKLNDFEKEQPNSNIKLIVVGNKLAMKMVNDSRVVRTISGYETAEEIPKVILNLIQLLEEISLEMKIKIHPAAWRLFFNQYENNKVDASVLHPFVEFATKEVHPALFPPLLTLTINQFVLEFVNSYLLSILYSIFYRSFIAENYQRVHQLEGTLDRLDKSKNQLTQQLNLIRQETITQEIEIIMLSVEAITNEI